MKRLFVTACAGLALCGATMAQATPKGTAEGAAAGAVGGAVVAGPVGAVVGGIVGGVTGGISGLLGIDQRPDFANYVASQHLPSDSYRAAVSVGNVLPETGIQYYELPRKYGVKGYRYAIVNDQTVLVDPMTRRIVEVEN